MKKLILTAAAAALAVSACGGESADSGRATASAAPPASSASGTPSSGTEMKVPAELKFEATKLDGGMFDGTSLAGKPVVFWFWAPWCPKCQAEGPAVAKAAQKYGDKVAFVGIGGLDKNREAMNRFVSRTGTSGLVQLDDRAGTLYKHFRVTSQSSYLFMNAEGGTQKATGPLDEKELSALIDDHAM